MFGKKSLKEIIDDMSKSEGPTYSVSSDPSAASIPEGFYNPLAGTTSYTSTGTLYEMYHLISEIHLAACCNLCNTEAEAVVRLQIALEEMPDCEHDCKSCKYYVPGGIEKCDTLKRVAEYLVHNGIVRVFRPS